MISDDQLRLLEDQLRIVREWAQDYSKTRWQALDAIERNAIYSR